MFENWKYKRKIIIDNTLNTTALTDHQVCIEIDTYDLINNNKMTTSGTDVRFVDSDGVTLLNHWVENIPSSGTKFWVKIPTIVGSDYKTIYMYYGNTTATDISTISGTFIREIDNIIAAFEFNENGSHIAIDLSGNKYDATLKGPVRYRKENRYYLEFDSIDNYVKIDDGPSIMSSVDTSGEISICCWTKPKDNYKWFFIYGVAGDPENNFEMSINGNDKLYLFWEYGSGLNYSATSTGTITLNKFQHIAITAKHNEVCFYKNGLPIGDETSTPSFWSKNSNRDIVIGAYDSIPSDRYFNGLIGEYYIFSDILSADEVSDIANNKLYVPSTYTNKAVVRKYSYPETTITVEDEISGYFEGYVYEENVPVSRRIYLHKRNNGELMSSTTSSGDGYYYIETTYSGLHYIIAIDDNSIDGYNLARLDKMTPVQV